MRKLAIRLNISNIIFYLLILVYSLTATDEAAASGSMYKYLVLVLGIIEAYIIYRKNKSVQYGKKEFSFIIFTIALIFIYSIFKMILASKYSFRIVQETLFLICPVIYAYLFCNIKNYNQIRKVFIVGLLISFCLYIASLGLGFNQLISALKDSNFAESSSELESGSFSGLALAFAVFFIYDGDKKYKLISILFVIMTFKRFSIIMVLILYLIPFKRKITNFKISRKIYVSVALGIVLFCILYYLAMQPQNVVYIQHKFNINMALLTMTRSSRFAVLLNSNFVSYGIGSSNEFLYAYINGGLEMDLVRLIMEVGYIPVVCMIFSYLNIARSNLYFFVFMTLKVVSLIFSSNLTNILSWLLTFIMLFAIIRKENEK